MRDRKQSIRIESDLAFLCAEAHHSGPFNDLLTVTSPSLHNNGVGCPPYGDDLVGAKNSRLVLSLNAPLVPASGVMRAQAYLHQIEMVESSFV